MTPKYTSTLQIPLQCSENDHCLVLQAYKCSQGHCPGHVGCSLLPNLYSQVKPSPSQTPLSHETALMTTAKSRFPQDFISPAWHYRLPCFAVTCTAHSHKHLIRFPKGRGLDWEKWISSQGFAHSSKLTNHLQKSSFYTENVWIKHKENILQNFIISILFISKNFYKQCKKRKALTP